MYNLDNLNDDNLNNTIRNLTNPQQLPHKLPIVHMSNALQFPTICQQGYLKPRKCQVFNKDLLYFFYGGAFYRSKNEPTREPTQLPIAFLFDPRLINKVARYFPFDTGAAAAGIYGSLWSKKLRRNNFQRYSVDGNVCYVNEDIKTPCKLVYYIYGSNTDYLEGNFKDLTNQPEPLRELDEFLNTDLTKVGCDHRQFIIECQIEQEVDLLEDLIWMAFPARNKKDFINFCGSVLKDSVPDYYEYKSHRAYRPSAIEQQIEAEARKFIEKRYLRVFETL